MKKILLFISIQLLLILSMNSCVEEESILPDAEPVYSNGLILNATYTMPKEEVDTSLLPRIKVLEKLKKHPKAFDVIQDTLERTTIALAKVFFKAKKVLNRVSKKINRDFKVKVDEIEVEMPGFGDVENLEAIILKTLRINIEAKENGRDVNLNFIDKVELSAQTQEGRIQGEAPIKLAIFYNGKQAITNRGKTAYFRIAGDGNRNVDVKKLILSNKIYIQPTLTVTNIPEDDFIIGGEIDFQIRLKDVLPKVSKEELNISIIED